jgi:hypothetical protein
MDAPFYARGGVRLWFRHLIGRQHCPRFSSAIDIEQRLRDIFFAVVCQRCRGYQNALPCLCLAVRGFRIVCNVKKIGVAVLGFHFDRVRLA